MSLPLLFMKKNKKEEAMRLHALFREIWDEREDLEGVCYCFESGQRMDGSRYRGNTCVYDHVLEKGKYPEYKFLKKNIIIIKPEIHEKKGKDIDSVPKIKKYREYLLSLHYENKLE